MSQPADTQSTNTSRHLSDSALMELLYVDFSDPTSPDAQNHLQQCDACRRRLARYRSVTQVLSGELPAGQPHVLATHPTVTLDVPPVPPRRTIDRRAPQGRWWTAAVVVFVAAASGLVALGFNAGVSWQAQKIDQAVARQWRAQEQANRDLHEQLVQATTRWEQSLHALTQQVASFQTSHDRLQTTTLPSWEAILTRLIENQTRLRTELETLAVSAETEIARTQQNLRNLEQRRQLVFGPALE